MYHVPHNLFCESYLNLKFPNFLEIILYILNILKY